MKSELHVKRWGCVSVTRDLWVEVKSRGGDLSESQSKWLWICDLRSRSVACDAAGQCFRQNVCVTTVPHLCANKPRPQRRRPIGRQRSGSAPARVCVCVCFSPHTMKSRQSGESCSSGSEPAVHPHKHWCVCSGPDGEFRQSSCVSGCGGNFLNLNSIYKENKHKQNPDLRAHLFGSSSASHTF